MALLLDLAPITVALYIMQFMKRSSFNKSENSKMQRFWVSIGYLPHFTAPDSFWSIKFSKKNLRKLFRIIIF